LMLERCTDIARQSGSFLNRIFLMSWRANQRWDLLTREWGSRKFDPDLRIAILAAHPDDETIGASALLALARPRVIFLTDGAPRDRRFWPQGYCGTREDYASCRRAEAQNALAIAGISPERITWLGGTDQEAIFEAGALAARLANLSPMLEAGVLITHPYEGGHPDHDAAALIASATIRQSTDCLLLEMTSYHAREGGCETGEFLNSDPAQEAVFELSAEDQQRKQEMLNAYASQKLVLQSFPVDRERLRIAPKYDFSRPPHAGPLWYETMGWMTGAKWRATTTEAMREAHAADGA
jgi:LmbE family N-acetylglucosaminyl deacetylase